MRARRRVTGMVVAGALAAGALGAVLAGSGCNYAGAALLIVEGPPKVQAAYEGLDKNRKTVIFIDDRGNVAPRRSLRRVIGQAAEETLIAEKLLLAENVIPSNGPLHATAQEKRSEAMSIADVGKALGAEVVIYVNLHQFGLSREAAYQPYATGYVKIIDVTSNTRIWPPGGDAGHAVSYQFTASAQLPSSLAERAAAEEKLAKLFGREVGRVFFDHVKDYASDKRVLE